MIKVLLAISALFGIGAAALGFMTKGKVEDLKSNLADTTNQLTSTQSTLKKTEDSLKTTETKLGETVTALETTKAESVRLGSELSAATAKVQDLTTQYNEASKAADEAKQELKKLQDQMATLNPTDPAGGPAPDLQTKLADMQKQIEAAEAEKAMLADQLRGAKETADKLAKAEEQRQAKVMSRGLTGRVLAVNPAWNFVVLNLGDRQGVVEGGEMVIRRGNVMVGKIKISSVEPSTSIGDIVMSSVPRGMQVQPGDLVVYSGH